MPLLDSAYAKLARARHHARKLEEMLEAVFDPDENRFIGEQDGQPSKLVFRVERCPAIPPELSPLIGDYLFNLRSALDHLAWVLVPDNAPAKINTPKKIQFPISDSRFDKKGKPNPARILGVTDPAVVEAVEAVQPYQGSTPAEVEGNLLGILNTLCNMTSIERCLLPSSLSNRNAHGGEATPTTPFPRFASTSVPCAEISQ